MIALLTHTRGDVAGLVTCLVAAVACGLPATFAWFATRGPR